MSEASASDIYQTSPTNSPVNRRSTALGVALTHTRLKVLYFDGTGLWLMTKRLEEGTFAWPKLEEIGCAKLALRAEAFTMLTDGIDLRGAKMRPWFERAS